MPIVLALIPVLIQLAGLLIKHFVRDKELIAEFEMFSEKARHGNIKGIVERRRSEDRLLENEKKWAKIEDEERNRMKGKKQ